MSVATTAAILCGLSYVAGFFMGKAFWKHYHGENESE